MNSKDLRTFVRRSKITPDTILVVRVYKPQGKRDEYIVMKTSGEWWTPEDLYEDDGFELTFWRLWLDAPNILLRCFSEEEAYACVRKEYRKGLFKIGTLNIGPSFPTLKNALSNLRAERLKQRWMHYNFEISRLEETVLSYEENRLPNLRRALRENKTDDKWGTQNPFHKAFKTPSERLKVEEGYLKRAKRRLEICKQRHAKLAVIVEALQDDSPPAHL